MSLFPTVLSIIGGITLWCMVGFLFATLFAKYDSDYYDQEIAVPLALFWPLAVPILFLVCIMHDGIPWIKKKWRQFRAPAIKAKEEAQIEKIRMCPALKLKKYEEILNKIANSHERRYWDDVAKYSRQFERIRDGKPEVKEVVWDVNPAVVPRNMIVGDVQAQMIGLEQAPVWYADVPVAQAEQEVNPEPF